MKIFALTILTTLLLAGALMAQSDPYGETDTLYLDQLTVGAGQEFEINVNLWNDEVLGGITIPLVYPTDMLEFPEVIFAGGRVDYINTKPLTIDEAGGTVLVGAIVFFEDYIAPGDGSLFKIKFKLKDGLTPGEIATIDTTSIPPAQLLLSHADATNIIPVFKPGIITVGEKNGPPVFSPIADIYTSEGDSVYIDISTTDPDGDDVMIANPIHPFNSTFVDNGDGTARFAWKPDFVGPNSSDQSPFELVFWASDGSLNSAIEVMVNVINVNRAPHIECPELVTAEAGDSIGIVVTGIDPDFDVLSWEIDGLPAGATFDYENPGFINWVTEFADSGNYMITMTATDPSGLADTAEMELDIIPVTLYSVRIDTVTSFSGRIIDLEIFMKNKYPVSEFNLLINFDAAILFPMNVTNDGTRTENFEFFGYTLNDGGNMGDVRIIGKADVAGDPVGTPMGEGDGLICRLSVQISPNLTYVGSYVPIRFVNRLPSDNIITLEGGTDLDRESVNWFDGSILISSPGTTRLGDINLNGLAYEIADAVYFSNFFISPGMYPLDDQQIINSDINKDGFAPSVADLVAMIQVIAGAIPPPEFKVLPSGAVTIVELLREQDGLYISTDSPVDIAGALFRFGGQDIDRIMVDNLTGLDVQSAVDNDLFSCLMISYSNETISFGKTSVIKLSDNPNINIELEHAEIADADGRVLNIEMKENAILPNSFALHQNSPNPFNPVTDISFDLGSPAWVTLAVYNVLGQEVVRLAEREFPSGSHTVTWDGTDSDGRTVASGIYLYRIKAGEHSASRKMVLMK